MVVVVVVKSVEKARQDQEGTESRRGVRGLCYGFGRQQDAALHSRRKEAKDERAVFGAYLKVGMRQLDKKASQQRVVSN